MSFALPRASDSFCVRAVRGSTQLCVGVFRVRPYDNKRSAWYPTFVAVGGAFNNRPHVVGVLLDGPLGFRTSAANVSVVGPPYAHELGVVTVMQE